VHKQESKGGADAFFEFDSESENDETIAVEIAKTNEEVNSSLQAYLNDENTHLNMLDRHPEMKEIFLKHNTPLASSGSAERLFSYATMVNTPKASKLSDDMFEQRVVLKANAKWLKT